MGKDLEQPLIQKPQEPFKVYNVPPPAIRYNPFAWLLWTLDITTWFFSVVGPFRWTASLFMSKKCGIKRPDGAVRLAIAPDMVKYDSPERRTVHEVMQHSFKTFADCPACGTRKYLGTHQVEGSRFPLQMFGETQWLTYAQFGERVKNFGAGLRALGLKPVPQGADLQTVQGPHSILIYEETSLGWMTSLLGAFSQSIAVATSYSTLGLKSVAESIRETEATAIVCNIKDVEKVAKACGYECPSLKTIIYTTNNSLETTAKPFSTSLKVISIDEVVGLGEQQPVEFTCPTPESVAVIMYTSGSTGKPKGVMITQANLVASIAGMHQKFNDFGLVKGKESYLAYLPAAHILELVAELTCLSLGVRVGFGDPRTISSKGACRKRPDGSINTQPNYPYPPGAIQEFQPSIFVAVPKIWDILKKGAEEAVGKGSPIKKFLFQVAYTGRSWAISQGRDSPLFKKVVFSKLSSMLGGKLKVGISGGGPISADVQNFIRTAFAVPLIQGYALTESCCGGTVQLKRDMRNGIVGPPLGSVELKLRTCVNAQGEPEILDRQMKPYCAEDKSHYGAPCMGRGEVMIRGPSLSLGYFKQKSKTDEVFDADGWFHSGDVGVLTPDGCLMIVDRVKNLVKLKGGEYVAIEAMEKEYANCPFVNPVNGGIICYGDGDIDRPVALMQANMHELEKWAKGANVSYSSAEELCKKAETNKMVLDNLVKIAKNSDLGANEVLGAVGIIPGTGPSAGDLTDTAPWTPENGGLTASNKLNRQGILKACGSIMEDLKAKATR